MLRILHPPPTPNYKQGMSSEERGSEFKINVYRISEKLLTYAINFVCIVLDDIKRTGLFYINKDKELVTFFLNFFFQRLRSSFPSLLSFEFLVRKKVKKS